MRIILGLVRFIVGLVALGAALFAVAGFFGFAVPQFDLLNHLQLVLFFGTLATLLLALILFGRSRWRAPVLVVAGLGLVASGAVFVPEWVASLESRPAAPSDGRPVLRLMTHNLFGRNYDMVRVAAIIAETDPDIIAFQEYFPEQATTLAPLLKAKYPYAVRCQGGKRANLGLYSKIPFEKEMAKGDCPTNAQGTQRTAHIAARFALADGTIFTVVTSHMDWPYPIERQQAELAELAAVVDGISGPLLVVGDFNSTPWSYALKGFAAATKLRRETRNLVTYPVRFTVPHRLAPDGLADTLPFLALDQVFERGVEVQQIGTGPATGSDHLPVVLSFSIAPIN